MTGGGADVGWFFKRPSVYEWGRLKEWYLWNRSSRAAAQQPWPQRNVTRQRSRVLFANKRLKLLFQFLTKSLATFLRSRPVSNLLTCLVRLDEGRWRRKHERERESWMTWRKRYVVTSFNEEHPDWKDSSDTTACSRLSIFFINCCKHPPRNVSTLQSFDNPTFYFIFGCDAVHIVLLLCAEDLRHSPLEWSGGEK